MEGNVVRLRQASHPKAEKQQGTFDGRNLIRATGWSA